MAESLARRLRLVFVTPGDRAPAATAELVEACAEGGVTAVLLRERQLPDAERRALYGALVPRLRALGVLALVSREVDDAAALGADGVQLGHDAPSPAEARATLPAGTFVGRSAHWPLRPDDLAADYVTLSPFAPTPRSRPRPLLRAEQVAATVARLAPRPVVALGGLDAAALLDLPPGVCGAAVLRALADAPDPRGAAAQLRSLLDARADFGVGAEADP